MAVRRYSILILLNAISMVGCSVIQVQPTPTLVNPTESTFSPLSATPTLPPTPSRTATPSTATLLVPTEAPSLIPTITLSPSPTVQPFYQTPTFDPATIATVTKAPAAQCPAVNPDLKPVLPDQGKPEASGYIFDKFHLQKDVLDTLNQGASLPDIQKALTTVTGGGKLLGLSPRDLYEQDLTGDGVPEIVFFNRAYRYAIFSCQGGRYTLALDIPSVDLFTIEQLSVEDLNRDKLPEIVVGITDSAARLWPTYVYIFRWNGEAFQDLSLSESGNEIHLLRGFIFFYFTGRYEIKDIDHNGLKEIVVQEDVGYHAEAPLYGPWRDITEIVVWNGAGFVLLPTRYTPPVYRFQAVQDGDRAFLRWDFEEALSLYQQVLNDRKLKGWSEADFKHMQEQIMAGWDGTPTPTPLPDDPTEYPTLAAYARFKILLVHLAQGKVDQARSEYERLQLDFPQGQPGSGFAGIAKEFWDEYTRRNDLASACANAREYADSHKTETIAQIDVTWHGWQSPGYGYDGPSIEMYMCPFE